ncbi:uncharacterized protein FTOL_09132 [Fusarium torulosum]|uniref:Uncharacterized protein n=1 Tax=Fusarium torulosum TaxID=33205 RepID=A0AAE8SL40_9HYPO|nr:uncharacterized protein FTOL_09132 [Fusarium torulosum]
MAAFLFLLPLALLGYFKHDNIELYCKYGPIIRYSPNRYSFNHPEAA